MEIKTDLISEDKRQQIVKDWYSCLEVLFKMVEYTKNRETVFLISKAEDPKKYYYNTRYLRVECVRDFNYLLQMGLHMFDEKRLYNLYYSITEFKKPIPFLKFDSERKSKIKNWAEQRMIKETESYDFFIDVDCDKITFEGGKITVRKIKELFDKYAIPFEIRCSGKGFHIIVDGKVFNILGYNISEDLKDENNICYVFGEIGKRLNKHVSNLIDDGVYDYRRVTKIPYSLVHYSEEVRVCFPFDSEFEFEGFKYEDGNAERFIEKLRKQNGWNWRSLLRERQTFIFNKGFIPNVEGFIKEVLSWEN